jgi:hypothetical protein
MTVKGQHIKAHKVLCPICSKVMTKPGLVGHMVWNHGKRYKAPLLNVPKPMLFGEAKHNAKLFDQTKQGLYIDMQNLLNRINSDKALVQRYKKANVDSKTIALYEHVTADHERQYLKFKAQFDRLNKSQTKPLNEENHDKSEPDELKEAFAKAIAEVSHLQFSIGKRFAASGKDGSFDTTHEIIKPAMNYLLDLSHKFGIVWNEQNSL